MCWTEETIIKKTRKDFRCMWCWEMIPKGSPCHRHRGIVDGQYSIARLHPECAIYGVGQLDYCETYMPGEGERPKI